MCIYDQITIQIFLGGGGGELGQLIERTQLKFTK